MTNRKRRWPALGGLHCCHQIDRLWQHARSGGGRGNGDFPVPSFIAPGTPLAQPFLNWSFSMT